MRALLAVAAVAAVAATGLAPGAAAAPVGSDGEVSDKFTVAMSAYSLERLPLVRRLVAHYGSLPQVDQIYVIWNDNTTTPPAVDSAGAPVTVLRMTSDSLNNRFLPLPGLRTRAVAIMDDDIEASHSDMQFAFHVWQQHSESLVGFFPRVHTPMGKGRFKYEVKPNMYSMILTKLMFLDARYLDEYTSRLPEGVREFVDEGQNCEDLAMNFLVSKITEHGPVLVQGSPVDYGDSRNTDSEFTSTGIGQRQGHQRARRDCLERLTVLFGRMTLRVSRFKAVPYERPLSYCVQSGVYRSDCEALDEDLDKALTTPGMVRSGERSFLEPMATGNEYGYVTLVTSESLVRPALVWARLLRLTGTPYDLVLMITEAGLHSVRSHAELYPLFDQFVTIPYVTNPYNSTGYCKINAWTLTQYKKLVYVDVDAMVLQNLDHLLEDPRYSEPAAVPDIYVGDKFNSGLMVIEPSMEKYERLLEHVKWLPSYNKGDQGFFNAYYDDWYLQSAPFHRLPFGYNTIAFFPGGYNPPAWYSEKDIPNFASDVKLMHFANPWFKPWSSAVTYDHPLINIWWDVNTYADPSKPYTIANKLVKGTRRVPTHRIPTAPAPAAGAPKTKGSGQSDKAFVTYVNAETYYAAAVFYIGINRAEFMWKDGDVVLMVGPDVSAQQEKTIRNALMFDKVVRIEAVANPYDDEQFNLLRLWELREYERVVYIDVLSLFLANVDDLMNRYVPFAAAPTVYPPDKFSTQVMIIRPSDAVFKDIVAKIGTLEPYAPTFEAFLNEYYYEWYSASALHRLPCTYHVDFWFKSGLMRYFKPYTLIQFDSRALPWQFDLEELNGERMEALHMWWNLFCSIEKEALKPVEMIQSIKFLFRTLPKGCSLPDEGDEDEDEDDD